MSATQDRAVSQDAATLERTARRRAAIAKTKAERAARARQYRALCAFAPAVKRERTSS